MITEYKAERNRPILFLPSNDTHVLTFLEAARRCRVKGLSIHFLSLDTFLHQDSEKVLKRSDLPWARLEEMIDSKTAVRKLRGLMKMLAVYHSLAAAVAFRTTHRVFVYRWLIRLFTRQIVELAAVSSLMLFRPAILVIANSQGYIEKTFLRHASKRCEVLWVQEGLVDAGSAYSPYIDSYAVMGPSTRESLVRLGAQEDSVYVIGQPRFDSYWSLAGKHRYTGSRVPLTLVFATDFAYRFLTSAQRRSLTTAVCNASVSLQAHLIIKVHPRENIDDYRPLLTRHANVEIVKDTSIAYLAENADFWLTVASTTGLEATVFHKPVVILDFYGKPQSRVFIRTGATLVARTETEIRDAILRFEGDEKSRLALLERSRRFLAQQIYPQDGAAAERLFQVIVEKTSAHHRR